MRSDFDIRLLVYEMPSLETSFPLKDELFVSLLISYSNVRSYGVMDKAGRKAGIFKVTKSFLSSLSNWVNDSIGILHPV